MKNIRVFVRKYSRTNIMQFNEHEMLLNWTGQIHCAWATQQRVVNYYLSFYNK